jgi:hypothetical protein
MLIENPGYSEGCSSCTRWRRQRDLRNVVLWLIVNRVVDALRRGHKNYISGYEGGQIFVPIRGVRERRQTTTGGVTCPHRHLHRLLNSIIPCGTENLLFSYYSVGRLSIPPIPGFLINFFSSLDLPEPKCSPDWLYTKNTEDFWLNSIKELQRPIIP